VLAAAVSVGIGVLGPEGDPPEDLFIALPIDQL
jgi:hypothetical protein